MTNQIDAFVVIPANRSTEVVLREIPARVAAGCCVAGAVSGNIDFLNRGGTGNVTVSLESPDLQSQELGGVFEDPFVFNDTIFQGAVAEGVWKLILFASPNAAGWTSIYALLRFRLGQCV